MYSFLDKKILNIKMYFCNILATIHIPKCILLINYISFLAIKLPEKKFSKETLAAIYKGKVMTIVMFGIA